MRGPFEVQDALPTVLSCAQLKACVLNSQNHPICFIKTIKAVFLAQCVSSPLFLENVNLNSGGRGVGVELK